MIFFMAMPAFKGFGLLLQPFSLINEFLDYAFRIKAICNVHSLCSIIPFIYSMQIIYVIFCFTCQMMDNVYLYFINEEFHGYIVCMESGDNSGGGNNQGGDGHGTNPGGGPSNN
jgi:hypothetical protein